MNQMIGLKDTMGIKCISCEKVFPPRDILEIDDENYCITCFLKKEQSERAKFSLDSIILTTTHSIDGYKVKKYIGIESVEIVVGTGLFSEFTSGIDDFLGARSTAFEKKLAKAKETAFKMLKLKTLQKKGNAVLGIDMDYTEFSGNRIGLIVNGTVVFIEPV